MFRPIHGHHQVDCLNPLNAELNPICHLLALLGGATIVVVSRLRVKYPLCNKFHCGDLHIIARLHSGTCYIVDT